MKAIKVYYLETDGSEDFVWRRVSRFYIDNSGNLLLIDSDENVTEAYAVGVWRIVV